VSISETEIVYKLEFADPADLSTNDILRVTTNFTSFEWGLIVTTREIPCTRQVVNGTATRSVEAASVGTQALAVAASIGSAIVQTFMCASLS